jgi:hypothetical protein
MDNNYDELEHQIGNAGADEQPLKPQGKGLGELQEEEMSWLHQDVRLCRSLHII